jgi:hypothetical protein
MKSSAPYAPLDGTAFAAVCGMACNGNVAWREVLPPSGAEARGVAAARASGRARRGNVGTGAGNAGKPGASSAVGLRERKGRRGGPEREARAAASADVRAALDAAWGDQKLSEGLRAEVG